MNTTTTSSPETVRGFDPSDPRAKYQQVKDGDVIASDHDEHCAQGYCPTNGRDCTAVADTPSLADELPGHIRHYVRSIRPHLLGDQRVVEFFKPGGILAIDEEVIIGLAALLIENPYHQPRRSPDMTRLPTTLMVVAALTVGVGAALPEPDDGCEPVTDPTCDTDNADHDKQRTQDPPPVLPDTITYTGPDEPQTANAHTSGSKPVKRPWTDTDGHIDPHNSTYETMTQNWAKVAGGTMSWSAWERYVRSGLCPKADAPHWVQNHCT